jgi:hypothetical protein
VPDIRAPRAWLKGWHPGVLVAQRIAGDRTSRAEDLGAGEAPILHLQPDHDSLAHARDAAAFAHALGDCATIVVSRDCSHAGGGRAAQCHQLCVDRIGQDAAAEKLKSKNRR